MRRYHIQLRDGVPIIAMVSVTMTSLASPVVSKLSRPIPRMEDTFRAYVYAMDLFLEHEVPFSLQSRYMFAATRFALTSKPPVSDEWTCTELEFREFLEYIRVSFDLKDLREARR